MEVKVFGDGIKNLKELLEEKGASPYAPCAGRGTCGQCIVTVLSGSCPPSKRDKEVLSVKNIERGMRLACRAFPVGEVTVSVVEGDAPVILSDFRDADEPRVSTGESLVSSGKTRAFSDAMPNPLCIGIDLGTTTVVMAVPGADGHPYVTRSFLNPLSRYGADVVSRLEAASVGKLTEMRDMLRQKLEEELRSLVKIQMACSKATAGDSTTDARNASDSSAGAPDANVHFIGESNPEPACDVRIALAGNTVMTHIFMGWDTSGLGTYPFRPFSLSCAESTLCGFPVFVFPGIGAFVGGDIVAGIYGLDLINGSIGDMLMDLGTNGEIVLKTKNGLIAASASAGPALEGAHLSCGTGCVEGAVTGITLENLRPVLTVAGSSKNSNLSDNCSSSDNSYSSHNCSPSDNSYPSGNKGLAGACGSAILELTDELLRTGLLSADGTFSESCADEGFAFGTDRNGRLLALTQADVRELQLAKGAVSTAALMLCEKGGVDPGDLNISLAGGMGSGLRPERIGRTGIIPSCASVRAVGNSALSGLMKFLRISSTPESKNTASKVLSNLAGSVTVYNLALESSFEEKFLNSLSFRTF